MPMMRIERMTSPLPRECSTTEPHGQGSGAGEGNRTLVGGLEGPSSTIELHPLKFEDYIIPPRGTFLLNCCSSIAGGGGWIRTIVGVSQQIYSLPPLATRAPLRRISNYSRIFSANSRNRVECNINSCGAAGGDRTHDPWLRRPILYPLSYSRCGTDGCGSIFREPMIIARLMSCRPTPARTRPNFLFIIS